MTGSLGDRAENDRLAVVMITRNRAEEAVSAVGRLLALPERPAVVVVDNGSSDGTSARLRSHHPAALVLRSARNLGAAGRNVGVLATDASWVAFCDDDTAWASGSLSHAVDLLRGQPTLGLACGRVLVEADRREDPTCAAMAQSPLPARPGQPGIPVLGFLACAAVVRRSAFLGVGGFERRLLIGGEEELLALDLAAAGWNLVYVPDIVVHHDPSSRRNTLLRRRMQARNSLWVSWMRHPTDLAWARTVELVRQAREDPSVRRGVMEAFLHLGWTLRRRRVVPPDVADSLRRLELNSRAADSPAVEA